MAFLTLAQIQAIRILIIWFVCARVTHGGNLALRQPTAHSSESHENTYSSMVVDGDTRAEIQYCFVSKTENNPWWRVDLGRSFIIDRVRVVGRSGCCFSRMNGAAIRVGDSLANDGSDNPVCNTIQTGGKRILRNFRCKPSLRGRYVTIHLKKNGGILELCEVMVNPETKANIAKGQPVRQSSTSRDTGLAEKAVDGNSAGRHNFCTLTNKELNPWWRVDFGSVKAVSEVYIVKRITSALRNIEIRVGKSLKGNGNSNPRCGGIHSMATLQKASFYCRPRKFGRYLNIRLVGPNMTLTLCEVEVFSYSNVTSQLMRNVLDWNYDQIRLCSHFITDDGLLRDYVIDIRSALVLNLDLEALLAMFSTTLKGPSEIYPIGHVAPGILTCPESFGYPIPYIAWVRDGVVYQNTTSSSVFNYSAYQEKRNNDTVWECVVKNDHGSDFHQFVIKGSYRMCAKYKDLITNRLVTMAIKNVSEATKDGEIDDTQWFRLREPKTLASMQIPNFCVPPLLCSTLASGWLLGSQPKFEDGVVHRTVCFNSKGSCCQYNTTILVRRCYGYFVYKLQKTKFGVKAGYCAEHSKNVETASTFSSVNGGLNHALDGHVINTESGLSLYECVMVCLSEVMCRSINLDSNSGICEMNNATKGISNPKYWKERIGNQYYEKVPIIAVV